MLDFGFATSGEIRIELGLRLKAQRLAAGVSQEELAARAGVSLGTVKNLEKKGQCTLDSLVKVVLALGLVDQLQNLFELEVKSIAQMGRAEQAKRVRAPRTARP